MIVSIARLMGIVFLVVCLFGAIYKIVMLEAKITAIKSSIELNDKNKDMTDQAVESATRTREQLREQAQKQYRDTEEALKEHSDWADVLVPDSVRRMFEKERN